MPVQFVLLPPLVQVCASLVALASVAVRVIEPDPVIGDPDTDIPPPLVIPTLVTVPLPPVPVIVILFPLPPTVTVPAPLIATDPDPDVLLEIVLVVVPDTDSYPSLFNDASVAVSVIDPDDVMGDPDTDIPPPLVIPTLVTVPLHHQ